MEMKTYVTRNISLATALLCSEYVEVAADGAGYDLWEDGSPVVLADVVTVESVAGRKPLCEFTLACADNVLLSDKVSVYDEGRLFVAPPVYDRAKKLVVDAMRKARTVNHGKD